MKNNLTIFQVVNYFAISSVLLISIKKSLVSISSKVFLIFKVLAFIMELFQQKKPVNESTDFLF